MTIAVCSEIQKGLVNCFSLFQDLRQSILRETVATLNQHCSKNELLRMSS